MSKVVNQNLGTCIYTPLPVLPKEYISHTVPLPTLVAMSKLEHELRLNDDYYQRRFRAAARDSKRVAGGERPFEVKEEEQGDIIVEIQHHVLAKYGYATLIFKDENTGEEKFGDIDELALYELRTAAFQWPEEPTFQETVYFKYNRAGDIPLEDGDEGPDCELFEVDSRRPLSLYELLGQLSPEEEAEVAAVKAAGGSVEELRFPRVVVSGSYT
jgi:hypothetical protein